MPFAFWQKVPPASVNASYLVAAGGGGGGDGGGGGGGGGAGGLILGTASLTTGTTYTVTVGSGGTGSSPNLDNATNGGNSSITGTGLSG